MVLDGRGLRPDASGPKAGVSYDGWLTKADGKGKWWDGLDPQTFMAACTLQTPGN